MKGKSRTEYSLLNMITGVGGYTLNLIMSFICRIIFTRSLGATYLGVNGLFNDILSMLSLSELGIGTAMLYALYKPVSDNDENKIASYMKLYSTAYKIVGTLVAVLGIAIMPFIKFIIREPPDIKENIYLIYGLFLFSTASSYFFSYRSALIIANQRNYIVVGIGYITVILQNIAQIVLLLTSGNYIAYLLIQIICTLITNILISQKALHDYPYIKSPNIEPLPQKELKSLAKNIKAITINKLSGIIVNSTDNLVINYFNGLVTVGLASNYILLTTTLNALIQQIFSGITASIGNINATESDEKKYLVFRSLNLACFWIFGWATIGFFVLSNDIIEVFFGAKFVMPQSITTVLSINFYMLGMLSIPGIYKSTIGLFRYVQYNLLFTAAINLLGDIVLGYKFGIIGIYSATAISRLLTNAWYEPYVVYKHGLKRSPIQYLKSYAFNTIVLVVTATICYIICIQIKTDLFLRLLLKLIICIFIPNIIFFFVYRKRCEFKYLYKSLTKLKTKFSHKKY